MSCPLHSGKGEGLFGGEAGLVEGSLVGKAKEYCILEEDRCGKGIMRLRKGSCD